MKKHKNLVFNVQKFLKWGVDMFYSDDPIRDFERHDAQQQRELEKLPRCSECDEPIQDDYCFEINDELICEDCMNSNHRKWVEDCVS